MATLKAFTMPKWGIEMSEGTIAEWMVAEREPFAKGAVLALIETDKITNEIEAEAASALVRIIAGEVAGHRGPGATHTPMSMVHATLAPGARMDLPWRSDFNALVYVMSGRGTVGGAGAVSGAGGTDATAIQGGQLAVLGAGDLVTVTADANSAGRHTEPVEVIVLGGAPIREPIAWAGPFVMNTRAEVVQAFEDYQAGRLGRPN